MKISVITPSFNQGNYIEETIDSILSQDYSNIEYIIIDGGSSDNSIEVIKKYTKHLRYWVSEPDHGQSHAINKGFKHATGDVINWLNSDDYLEPGALTAIAEAFENPDVNVFVGRSNIVENRNILRQSRGTDVYPKSLAKTIGLARIDQPEHWWRKSVIDEIGPLNENLHFTMDRDWWIKYLLRFGLGGIVKSDSILTNFRLHAESKTVSQNSDFNSERNQYFASLAEVYNVDYKLANEKSNMRLISNLPERIDISILEQALEFYYLLRADEYYVDNDFASAREVLKLINPTDFDQESVKLYKKLKVRSQFPSGLINFVRKHKP